MILGKDVNERLTGSLAAAMMSIKNGADIVRVHDVAETQDLIKLIKAIENPIPIDSAN